MRRDIKRDKEKFERDNLKMRRDNLELKRYNKEMKNDKRKLEEDKEKIENNLEKLKNDSKKNYNKILNELDLLKNKVKELEEFHFSSKLRKLLKNLIEFIIDNFYPQYMLYQESIDRIYFVNAPRFPYNLEWVKDKEIIDALNRILELLFSTAKNKDFVIHFVDQRKIIITKESIILLGNLMIFSDFLTFWILTEKFLLN